MSKIEDFEEAFRVIKRDEFSYVGAHPLRLPLKGARGVYGGHTIAQTLLVAIESTRSDNGEYPYLPHSFHLYFIGAGNSWVPMEYRVEKITDGGDFVNRAIVVSQKGRVRATASCSFIRRGVKRDSVDAKDTEYQIPVPPLSRKYSDPNVLYQTHHTDYIRNAYTEEFLDYEKCPEENDLKPAERWITVWSGINNKAEDKYHDNPGVQVETRVPPPPPAEAYVEELEEDEGEERDGETSTVVRVEPKSSVARPSPPTGDYLHTPPAYQQSFRNPMFNLIGLADLSDSCLLTTLARILHLPWNPTTDDPFEDFDSTRDARHLMRSSMNIIQLFHYNAMSLDHHIYFHGDNVDDSFDVVKDWLCLTYQARRLANNRTVVRGHMFNKDNKVVATVIQEGLTYMFNGVPDKAKL